MLKLGFLYYLFQPPPSPHPHFVPVLSPIASQNSILKGLSLFLVIKKDTKKENGWSWIGFRAFGDTVVDVDASIGVGRGGVGGIQSGKKDHWLAQL